MFYSKTTGGFYDPAINGENIPADAVEITADQHAALLNAQSQGNVITADAAGNPVAVDPVSLMSLEQVRSLQVQKMYAAYVSIIAQDVSFTTAAGVTQTFQADADSMDKVQKMLSAYGSVGVPAGFWWKSSDNTHVAFTLADLQGLAKTMGDQGWTAFQRLDERKASIMSATTVADVQAVVW